MMTYQLAVIGGDGVGPEVTAQTLKAVQAAGERFGFTVEFDRLRPGRGPLPAHRRGTAGVRPGRTRRPRRDLAGSGRHPGRTSWSAGTRIALEASLRFRPVRESAAGEAVPGRSDPDQPDLTPDRCDLVVVRENTEGLYTGRRVVPPERTPPTRSPSRSRSTPAGESSGLSATPSIGPSSDAAD